MSVIYSKPKRGAVAVRTCRCKGGCANAPAPKTKEEKKDEK